MPIHRGPRLTDMISRLGWRTMPVQANIYKTWPNLAVGIQMGSGNPSPWVEFISAANAPTQPFTVTHVINQDRADETFVEIGIGAAGSEVVVGSCNIYGYFSYSYGHVTVLPIIPGGSRVAIRIYLGPGSMTIKIVTALLPKRLDPAATLALTTKQTNYYPGKSAMYDSNGIPNPISGAIWTYGSYTEMWAATVESSPSIIRVVSNINFNGNNFQVALATGAAGSEVDWGEFPVVGASGAGMHLYLPIPVLVPGSTRYAERVAAPTATLTVPRTGIAFIKGAVMP